MKQLLLLALLGCLALAAATCDPTLPPSQQCFGNGVCENATVSGDIKQPICFCNGDRLNYERDGTPSSLVAAVDRTCEFSSLRVFSPVHTNIVDGIIIATNIFGTLFVARGLVLLRREDKLKVNLQALALALIGCDFCSRWIIQAFVLNLNRIPSLRVDTFFARFSDAYGCLAYFLMLSFLRDLNYRTFKLARQSEAQKRVSTIRICVLFITVFHLIQGFLTLLPSLDSDTLYILAIMIYLFIQSISIWLLGRRVQNTIVGATRRVQPLQGGQGQNSLPGPAGSRLGGGSPLSPVRTSGIALAPAAGAAGAAGTGAAGAGNAGTNAGTGTGNGAGTSPLNRLTSIKAGAAAGSMSPARKPQGPTLFARNSAVVAAAVGSAPAAAPAALPATAAAIAVGGGAPASPAAASLAHGGSADSSVLMLPSPTVAQGAAVGAQQTSQLQLLQQQQQPQQAQAQSQAQSPTSAPAAPPQQGAPQGTASKYAVPSAVVIGIGSGGGEDSHVDSVGAMPSPIAPLAPATYGSGGGASGFALPSPGAAAAVGAAAGTAAGKPGGGGGGGSRLPVAGGQPATGPSAHQSRESKQRALIEKVTALGLRTGAGGLALCVTMALTAIIAQRASGVVQIYSYGVVRTVAFAWSMGVARTFWPSQRTSADEQAP